MGREDLAHPTRTRARRAAFTLTELMVVIMVISILAGTVLFTMYTAIEDAKVARTRTQITKLNELLMTRWESYRSRSVRLMMTSPLPGTPASPVTPSAAVRKNAKGMAGARLTALRDLMRMEMPDRKSDVLDNPVSVTIPYTNSTPPAMATLTTRRPALSREYLRRAKAVYASGKWTAPSWSVTHEDAECLYMIMASIRDIGSNGLDFVYEGEIGDLDGDGMPEILDAWGQPIAFIRWPAGFVAHPGPDFVYQTADDIPSFTALQNFTVDANNLVVAEDRDPFDPLRCDSRAPIPMNSSVGTAEYYFNFKLYPLVCSGGPDELLDIVRFDHDDSTTPPTYKDFHFNRAYDLSLQDGGMFNTSWPQNDPYAVMPISNKRLGEPFRQSFGYVDNITNHGLGE